MPPRAVRQSWHRAAGQQRVNTCTGLARARCVGDRTGCVPHHLAFQPEHLLGSALQLRLAWAWLPEDTSYARSPTPPRLTLVYHPSRVGI